MIQWFRNLACRLWGRACSVDRPATSDLRQAMRTLSHKTEKHTQTVRKMRQSGDFADRLLLGDE